MMNKNHLFTILFLAAFFSCAISFGQETGFSENFWMASQDKGKKETAREFQSGDDNFRLISEEGRSYSLVELTDRKIIVLISFNSNQSDFLKKEIFFRAEQLQKNLGQNGYVFLLHTGRAIHPISNSKLTVLLDTTETISKKLGFKKFGDYLVFNSKIKNQMPEVGGIGNILSMEEGQHIYALNTFIDQLKFKIKTLIYENFSSLKISYQIDREFSGKIVFNKEVEEAFGRQCMGCHTRYQEIDYFKTTNDLKNWSRMNRFVVRTMRMPPSGIDPDANHSLCDVPVETNERDLRDRWLIQNWLEAGSPVTEVNRPLNLSKRESTSLKKNMTPDLVWKMDKPHQIPANGTIEYKLSKIAGPTTEDYFIRGFHADFNLNVAHHVNIIVKNSDLPLFEMRKTAKPFRNENPELKSHLDFVEENILMTFSRRTGMGMFPQGTGLFLPKGSNVYVDIHYNPSGKVEKNQIVLGVFLAKPGEQKQLQILRRSRLRRKAFIIPAGERHFVVERNIVLDQPLTLIKAWSHAHNRAIASSIQGILPDGKVVPICNTPYYQFKYEINPNLGKEVFLPAGSTIKSKIWYDNSDMNPANPDDKREVPNGFQTDEHEMDFIRLVYVNGKLNHPIKGMKR